MRLTAKDLYDLNVIDKIIKEPKDDFEKLVKSLKKEIVNTTKELTNMTEEELVEQRYKKFRQMGEYQTI